MKRNGWKNGHWLMGALATTVVFVVGLMFLGSQTLCAATVSAQNVPNMTTSNDNEPQSSLICPSAGELTLLSSVALSLLPNRKSVPSPQQDSKISETAQITKPESSQEAVQAEVQAEPETQPPVATLIVAPEPTKKPLAQPAPKQPRAPKPIIEPKKVITAPHPFIYKVNDAGQLVCKTKNDKPSYSKKFNKVHMDMECCLDPDEIPNPHCTYSHKKYGKLLDKFGK